VNWYVGTDWAVIPAGGNSLRQVFVRLEEYEALAAELTEWKRMRNEAMAQATFNRNGIDTLAAKLAAEHMSHSCTIAEEHESRTAFQERIRELEATLHDISTIYPKELFPAVTALAYCRQKALAALSGAGIAAQTAAKHPFTGDGGQPCVKCGKPYQDQVHEFRPQPTSSEQPDRGAAK